MEYRWLSVCLIIGAMVRAAPATPPPSAVTRPADTRLPIPHGPALEKSERLVREVYQKEYQAATTAPARQALARRLMQQALASADDPVGRYILLREAGVVAASVADAPLACRAVEHLSRLYAVDRPALLMATLTAAQSASTAQTSAAVASAALDGIDGALSCDDYDLARRLVALAGSAVEKAKHVTLAARVRARAKEVQEVADLAERAIAARQTLALDINDPAANLLVGQFLCYHKGRWPEGLACLARSGDTLLAPMARREVAGGDAAVQFDLAGTWWDLAHIQVGLARRNLQSHAADLYRRALPGLNGLNRSVAEKRVEAIDLELLAEMNLRPGLLAELFKGIDFSERVTARVDDQVNFDWGEAPPDPALPKDNFSMRWTGILRVTAPGQYTLVLVGNAGAKLWVDEKTVADLPTLYRNRSGVKIPLDLPAGLHPLRLDYWDTAGMAKMQLLWIPPGGSKEQPIPASAFFHEMALDLEK